MPGRDFPFSALQRLPMILWSQQGFSTYDPHFFDFITATSENFYHNLKCVQVAAILGNRYISVLTYISVETRAIIYAFVNISSSSSANSDTIILHDIVGNILRFWIRELARMRYGIRTTGGLARNKSLM